jgi:FkbM family methyltransferase
MFETLLNTLRRKKVFRSYDYQVVDFDLPRDGKIQYAQWFHPGEHGNVVRQENVDFYRRYIRPGDLVIDVGANEGDTSVPMAIAAGKEGVTLALEPNPHVFKVLAANAALNPGLTNIVPLNFAATAHDGEFVFGSGDPSYGNGGIVGYTHNKARNVRFTLRVTGRNLEHYLRQHHADRLSRLSFIKIDAEGYDKEIVKTLHALIEEFRPTLVTECFGPSTAEEKQELHQVLVGLGYDVYRLTDFLGSPPERITEIKGTRTFDILAIPRRR